MSATLLRLPAGPLYRWLAEHYPQAFSLTRGLPLRRAARREPGYAIEPAADRVTFAAHSDADFCAACGEWLRRPGHAAQATPPLTFRAVMIDCSRNGVITVAKLQEIIPHLALLGLNAACLYTEDTYEVKGHPLIGYQRGKYTAAEIKALDRHARLFGVELFPCIQTLGHLAHLLKYRQYHHVRDNGNVLNVKKKETYALLETMIKSATAPYRSKRIHLGMDETHGLGLGNSFDVKNPIDPRLLYVGHVQKVAALCQRLKLEPIMWGDIVIGMTGTGAMNRAQTSKLPRNVEMNYWDYYREDPKIYASRIKQYRAMGFEPLLSPGVWNWNRFWPCFAKMEMSCVPFMAIAKRLKVTRAMITMWGDDGQECPFDANYPALALYLEHCMAVQVDRKTVKARLKAVTGADFDDLVRPQALDLPAGVKNAAVMPMNFGKALIWDDPLLSRIAAPAGKRRFAPQYTQLAKAIAASFPRTAPAFRPLLAFALRAAEFLELKADLHTTARQAYAAKNRRALGALARKIPIALLALTALQEAHRTVWMTERKPFGWERLDLRYGGQAARLRSFAATLTAYARGQIKAIPELAEPVAPVFPSYPAVPTVSYDSIATPSTAHV